MEIIGGWLFWGSLVLLVLYAIWARRNRPSGFVRWTLLSRGGGDWRERLWAAHTGIVYGLLFLMLAGMIVWGWGEQRKGDAACVARGGEPHHLGRGGFLCIAPGSTR